MSYYSTTRASSLLAAFGAAVLLLVYSVSSQSQLQVGYAVITADEGSRVPVATALFSFRNPQGILVAEAGVEAVRPLNRGRVFVDLDGTRTGVAFANASNQPVTADVALRDFAGREVDRKEIVLGMGEHLPRFVDDPEFFPDTPENFTGSLTFETLQNDPGLAAVTLRQGRNMHDEPLLATLPVVDFSEVTNVGGSDSIIFPHIGAGAGGGVILSTQFILINPSDDWIAGWIRLTSSEGQPLEGELDGVSGSEFAYELEPEGTYRATLRSGAGLVQGYAVVSVEQGTVLPAGTAIFQFRDAADNLVSETGVGAVLSTTRARILVDTVGTQTGVAIASPGNGPSGVTFELLDRNGLSMDSAEVQVPAAGHLARFAGDLFPDLPAGFTGLMEIRSQVPIVPVTLKLTKNGRGDLILTTLPVADLSRVQEATSIVFPQIGFGLGFSTRLIFISTEAEARLAGNVRFLNSNGTKMVVPVLGQPVSDVGYTIEAGGAIQVRPGNTATVADIQPDPSALSSTEVVVSRGNTVVVRPLVVDSNGEPRDDFRLTFHSIDPEIASVDELGRITGHQAGFSTLTLTAGGAVSTATITVVEVISGIEGFEITGIAQDLAGRLYLANARDHAILLSQGLQENPEVYAGMDGNPGFRNGLRLNSLFQGPSSLALNQADASLYVSDSENHVIRRVLPGPEGRAETLAGTGEMGGRDGSLDQATFHNPQGLALDGRGHLWVADSGNHVIRRVDLVEGLVETVAGSAGTPGFQDGEGAEARFNSPSGVAIEFEPFAQQLQREARGDPPPPVAIIVADTGNGLVRRVQNGTVETLVSAPTGVSGFKGKGETPPVLTAAAARPFDSPIAVAVDPTANIYVSDAAGQVQTILNSGEVVSAAPTDTFSRPSGLAVTRSGRVVVADRDRANREIVYGSPQIANVDPQTISDQGGTDVVISGRNFSSDTIVVVAGVLIDPQIENTRTIRFTAPRLPGGRTTITVLNRAGMGQSLLVIAPIRLPELPEGHITTVAGGTTYVGDGSLATTVSLGNSGDEFLGDMDFDSTGNLVFSNTDFFRVRRVDAKTGIITSVAGTGNFGFSGDGGPAPAAVLTRVGGIAIDANGNLFIADMDNNRVRKVDAATGVINTVAGNGKWGPAGDGGPATEASFREPRKVAVDGGGNLYIADRLDHRIRKVDALTGTIHTVAGNGEAGFFGDGGPATEAMINFPSGLAVDDRGHLYFGDSRNFRIRKVDLNSGIITTVAGNGEQGCSGNHGLATEAQIYFPYGVELDGRGGLLIALPGQVRRLDLDTGIITGVAGFSFSDDCSPAIETPINPYAVAVDGAENLLVFEGVMIRKVDALTNEVTRVAGNGEDVPLGDGDLATTAVLPFPRSIAVDGGGNLFIAEERRIRRVDADTGLITTVFSLPIGGGQFLPFSGLALDGAANLLIGDGTFNRILSVDLSTGASTVVAGTGAYGFSGDGGLATEATLNLPTDVAVDAAGNLFIADLVNHRVRKVFADSGIITTFAGTGERGFSGDAGPAVEAALDRPSAVAVDDAGNLFIVTSSRIRKVESITGKISTVAGGGTVVDDGTPAVGAFLFAPTAVTADSSGNLFIASFYPPPWSGHRIRKVDAETGILSTVAGTGSPGFSGDGGPAAAASLNWPQDIIFDQEGNLLVVDFSNWRIRGIRGPVQ